MEPTIRMAGRTLSNKPGATRKRAWRKQRSQEQIAKERRARLERENSLGPTEQKQRQRQWFRTHQRKQKVLILPQTGNKVHHPGSTPGPEDHSPQLQNSPANCFTDDDWFLEADPPSAFPFSSTSTEPNHHNLPIQPQLSSEPPPLKLQPPLLTLTLTDIISAVPHKGASQTRAMAKSTADPNRTEMLKPMFLEAWKKPPHSIDTTRSEMPQTEGSKPPPEVNPHHPRTQRIVTKPVLYSPLPFRDLPKHSQKADHKADSQKGPNVGASSHTHLAPKGEAKPRQKRKPLATRGGRRRGSLGQISRRSDPTSHTLWQVDEVLDCRKKGDDEVYLTSWCHFNQKSWVRRDDFTSPCKSVLDRLSLARKQQKELQGKGL